MLRVLTTCQTVQHVDLTEAMTEKHVLTRMRTHELFFVSQGGADGLECSRVLAVQFLSPVLRYNMFAFLFLVYGHSVLSALWINCLCWCLHNNVSCFGVPRALSVVIGFFLVLSNN